MLPSFRRREKTGDTVDKPFLLSSFSRRTSGSDRRRSMLVATRQPYAHKLKACVIPLSRLSNHSTNKNEIRRTINITLIDGVYLTSEDRIIELGI